MSDFVLIADSACDIPTSVLSSWDVHSCQLSLTFEGDERTYLNDEISAPLFYRRMRSGEVPRTSAVNVDSFHTLFERFLREGADILYLGFSSALSGTCRFAELAAADLQESYPGRRIRVVDTLSASAGYGLLLFLVSEMRRRGATLDEAAEYSEVHRRNVCHWFTVDDLNYLKRGGRISPTVAVIGQLLHIKPILHVDDNGCLIPISKVRGRKASITELADRYDRFVSDRTAPVFISHGDCLQDAETLAGILRSGPAAGCDIRIFDVGPVIGAHSGPGTLALFFLGEQR